MALAASTTSACTPFAPAATRPTNPQEPAAFLRQGRAFSLTPAAMTGAQKPHIVGKTEADEAAVRTALETLVVADESSSSSTGRWAITANGLGIERSFKFKNFTKTWVR